MKKAKVVATVAPGIYKLEDRSYRVVAHVGNSRLSQRRKEKRFAADAGIREMKRRQANTCAALSRETLRIRRDPPTADVPRYMTVMKRRLKHADLREDEINAWFPTFGERRGDSIETEEIRQQVLRWEADGFAASTISHRLSALSQLFEVLDGKKAYNPVLKITRLKEPKAKPDGKAPDTIQKVFAALEARVHRYNRGHKTLARLKVIALTGMRHSQVMRLESDHVFVDHDPPFVIVEEPGKDGEPHAKPLTSDGVEAFNLFVSAEAWGKFSQSAVYKSWKLGCEQAGVRFLNPYKLRHSYATALRAQGWTWRLCRS